MNNKIKVIIITGPTGVGKTRFSVELAKNYNAEIISCDSMQIYKEMNIGTAKITESEMRGIKHHLIDIIEPDKKFSVSDFQKMALEKICDINKRGKLAIIVGGTGLYIDSIIYNMDFNETTANYKRREELNNIYKAHGNDALLEILISLDPQAIEKVDTNNHRRVIRSIEILENKGEQKAYKTDLTPREDFEFKIFVLSRKREVLYDMINQRVDMMIEEGLIKEVSNLKDKGILGDAQAMKAIGYRQIYAYLNEQLTLEEAIELVKRDSRRYAKRQLTWFKKYESAITIDVENKENEEILKIMYESIENQC